MKIVVFNGSPRAEDGNTHRMVREFAAGAEEAGAEVENVFLAHHEIRPCTGCFACWTRTPGTCRLEDDAPELVRKTLDVDLVVYATPLYVDNVSGLTKVFMDRMIPLADPHFEFDASGETVHVVRRQRRPRLGVISNCGFPEQSHFQVLRLLFRRIARNLQTELAVEIYRGGGEALNSRNPLLKPTLAKYNRLLRTAGREVAETGRLSEDTTARLEAPIVPAGLYVKGANRHWDRALNRTESDG
ncbi:MAG: flavodoxin family protein [Candidatus Hydrogenedentes bacterium]|nr:flavodoxin family protein [Candidatus Hydrogenedentota bacterium]